MKNLQKIKNNLKNRRKARVRAKISGTATRPRLNVFRSLKHIYVQLIDDESSKTLLSVRETEVKDKKLKKSELAFKVGELVAKKAAEAGIKQAVFDRSSSKYHGRVKAIAEGVRKGGLKI